MNISKLSDASIKELYQTMKNRLDSVAKNPDEEATYLTQDSDWQSLFASIKSEMEKRHLM